MKFEYDRLLTDKEVATLFGVSVALLKRWRCYGGGPTYVKIGGPDGRAVRYRRADVDFWIASNAIHNCSSEAPAGTDSNSVHDRISAAANPNGARR